MYYYDYYNYINGLSHSFNLRMLGPIIEILGGVRYI